MRCLIDVTDIVDKAGHVETRWIYRLRPIENQPRGQGGIRTLGTVSGTLAFQASPFDHSGTCPIGRMRPFERALSLYRIR